MYGGQRGFMLTMVKDELLRARLRRRRRSTPVACGWRRPSPGRRWRPPRTAYSRSVRQGLKKLHVATASVDVQTGALIGFYAGQDYLQSQLNWARLGGSPGSSFKPFALAAGLKDGFALKDTFDGNAPFVLPDGAARSATRARARAAATARRSA